MLNSLKYAFAAVTSALAGGYVVAQKDPVAAPVAPVIPMMLASYEPGQDLDRKVSLNLNGSLSDVVTWLKGQKINFVVADEPAAKRKIVLNFQNRPLSEVLDAIAAAMGGSWDRNGETYVFQAHGRNPFLAGDQNGEFMKNFKWDALPKMDAFKWDGKVPDGKVWVNGKDMDWKQLEKDGAFKVFSGEGFKMPDMKNFPDGKFFEFKDLPDGNFKFFGADGQEPKIRIWVDGKEVKLEDVKGKNLEGKNVKVQVGDGKMNQEMQKHIEESMAAARKNLELYGKGHDEHMSAADRLKIEKSMAQAHEHMAKALKGVDKAKIEKEMAEALKHRKDFNEHQGLTDQQRKEIEKEMKQAHDEIAKALKGVDKAKIEKEMAEAMKHREKALKEHHGLNDQQRKQVEKEMKQAHEEMAKALKGVDKAKIEKEIAEAMKHREKALKEHKGLTDQQRKQIETEVGRARQEVERVHKGHVDNIRKLMNSLTPTQKELARKQGYLKLTDLTPEQRRLIDVKTADDSFTLSYSIGGESITIKN